MYSDTKCLACNILQGVPKILYQATRFRDRHFRLITLMEIILNCFVGLCYTGCPFHRVSEQGSYHRMSR
jgi:hypothetical protein